MTIPISRVIGTSCDDMLMYVAPCGLPSRDSTILAFLAGYYSSRKENAKAAKTPDGRQAYHLKTVASFFGGEQPVA